MCDFTLNKFRKSFSRLNALKEKYGVPFIDSHTHPFDVMGIVHYDDYKGDMFDNDVFNNCASGRPHLLERFGFNNLVNSLAGKYCLFFPDNVVRDIRKTYANTCKNRFMVEMNNTSIDYSVLLPIEPWSTTDIVGKNFQNGPFYILGSIDVHSLPEEQVKPVLRTFIDKYRIRGIKLHPNLQDFYPQPSHNSAEISRKLKIIYSFAGENNLYLLFHSGKSYFPNIVDFRYDSCRRSRDNALFDNFFDSNGDSEIFEYFDGLVVFAHLGRYGLSSVPSNLIKKVIRRFSNIFFDTSGSSPELLRAMLNLISYERVIFGSDALYNQIYYSMLHVMAGVDSLCESEAKRDEMLLSIFGGNFVKYILQGKVS